MAPPAKPQSVVVTGIGMRCPVGNDAVQSAASVRAGISGFAPWPYFGVTFGEDESLVAAATEPDLRDAAWTEKAFELIEAPMVEALAGAHPRARDPVEPKRAALFVAAPYAKRLGVAEEDFKAFVDDARAHWQEAAALDTVEIVAADHAAGLVAMARAVETLQKRERDLCVVAGVDSLLEPTFLHDLWAERRLKTPDSGSGLVPGEAAAVVVLERADDVARRQAPVLASVGSLVLDREPSGLRPAEALRAEGLSRAVHGALATVDPQTIHRIIVDLTGERWRFLEWGLVETRCLGKLPSQWQLWHPAEYLGDVGAASAVVGVVLATRAFARRYGGPGGILICASSTGGERGAMTLLGPLGG